LCKELCVLEHSRYNTAITCNRRTHYTIEKLCINKSIRGKKILASDSDSSDDEVEESGRLVEDNENQSAEDNENQLGEDNDEEEVPPPPPLGDERNFEKPDYSIWHR